MALPVTFATLPAGNTPASLIDTQFAAVAAMGTIYCTALGSNALTLTPTPNQPTVSAYSAGMTIAWIQPTTNTGAVTVSVSGLGAVNLTTYKTPTGVNALLTGGELPGGQLVLATFDGTQFQALWVAVLPLTGGTMTGQLVLTNTAAPQLVLNPASGNASLYMNVAAAGNERDIFGQTAGLNRWQLILGNSTGEGGGNVGSDFIISRFNDAGVALDAPLTITRSTGIAAFSHTLQAQAYQCKPGIPGAFRANQFNIDYTGTVPQLWMDNTNLGTFQFVSDYRIKRDIAPLSSMWERAKALKPISYRLKDYTPKEASERLIIDDDRERWGFVAHELQEILIEDAASGVKDEANAIQSPNPWTVIATLTKALQEAMARIEALEEKLP